ncbi:MAG: diphosphate--fructose-6-phosphate 1-phosphotransferase [Sphaerochaetaceae bacterium]
MKVSVLQEARYGYQPKLPVVLRNPIDTIKPVNGAPTRSVADQEKIKALFPKTYGLSKVSVEKGENPDCGEKRNVGVILSGGQAPGGHNVISGLFDALKKANPKSRLFGFLGGPSGITDDEYVEITEDLLRWYRNTGGFDIIGSGRTKLETEEQFRKCAAVCRKHGIGAIVIIGGDDSNTNAAVLAEYFKGNDIPVQVIGCPKTIDGDLKNENIEISFGFDTATKTYSELIGNIERDAYSAKKYWHFIKLMGRSASHIALECAMQTQPNICLIGEEVQEKKQSLAQVVNTIADAVETRAADGNNFGVVLVPEGLIEFIPEMGVLIEEINELLAKEAKGYAACSGEAEQFAFISGQLSQKSQAVFNLLPAKIKKQLLMDRDPHGNVQVSRIETEKLLAEMVGNELAKRKKEGTYIGKYSPLTHFFGYEGRCAFPSNFDADYCYALGYNAFVLIAGGLSGYMSSITKLHKGVDNWQAGGIPITMMFHMEIRNGVSKPVIRKALVELKGKPFTYFAAHRDEWARKTCYTYPGAIQYWGPANVCDATTFTLGIEQS